VRELFPELEPDLVMVNVFWNDLLYSCLKNWLPEYLIMQQPARWRQLLLRYSGVYRALVVKGASDLVGEDRVNARALSYYRRNLAEMIEECEMHGVRLVFVEPPFDPRRIPESGLQIRENQFIARDLLIELAEEYVRTMREVGAEHQVTTIGHRLAASEEAAGSDVFLDLVHPSPVGYRMMAEEIADHLVEEALLAAPAPGR
jgi:lysophospholipase L1-like esterase